MTRRLSEAKPSGRSHNRSPAQIEQDQIAAEANVRRSRTLSEQERAAEATIYCFER